MNKVMTQSTPPHVSVPQQPKIVKVSAPQPIHDIPRPKATQSAMPTHDEIARRAYQIYLEKGRPQNQSEEIWQQAEQEQLNRSLSRFLSS